MVISGMHITLVAVLVAAIAGFAARRWPPALLRLPARSWGMLAALPATLAYGELAGMGVSVQRALLMVAVAFVFALRERQLRPWLAWATALLLVLVVQPMAAVQTGFWLSFVTVAALLPPSAGASRSPPPAATVAAPARPRRGAVVSAAAGGADAGAGYRGTNH